MTQSRKRIYTIAEAIEAANTTRNCDERTIATGFDEPDGLIGGFSAGSLNVIASRAGMGKTALALQMAYNIASRGKKAVYFSLSETAAELALRLILIRAGLSVLEFRYCRSAAPDIARAVSELKNIDLTIIDELPAMSLGDVSKTLDEIGHSDIVFVDSIQLMRDVGRAVSDRSPRERAAITANTSWGLKQLAKKYGVPFVVTSQIRRSGNVRPRIGDLRMYGSIEQDADVIMLIHREPFTPKHADDIGTAELIVPKNRYGNVGSVNIGWKPKCGGFVNIEQ